VIDALDRYSVYLAFTHIWVLMGRAHFTSVIAKLGARRCMHSLHQQARELACQ